jgi:uncharacterized protein
MTKEIAEKTINYLFKHISESNRKEQKIVIYGGEPLLALDIVEFVSQKIRSKTIELDRKDVEIKTIIITNGSLISKEFARIAKEYNLYVSISLDGPKNVNDENRIYQNGNGTFDDIIKGFNILKENKVSASVSCTVTNDNVNDIDKLVTTFKDMGFSGIGFNILIGKPFSSSDIQQLSMDTGKKLVDVFNVARKINIYEDTTMRQVLSFIEGSFYEHNCAACGGQMTIDPHGMIGICHAFLGKKDHFIFNVMENPDITNSPIFKEWTRRSPINMPECHTCIAFATCGGGCPYNASVEHGTIWAIDEMYCNYAKPITEWLIWDLYEKIISDKT